LALLLSFGQRASGGRSASDADEREAGEVNQVDVTMDD